MAKKQLIAGVDEAGRGPLAGPLAVAAVFFKKDKFLREMHGMPDSKRLSEARREEIFAELCARKQAGELVFKVAFITAPSIDKYGIRAGLSRGVSRALSVAYEERGEVRVLLDGALRAPSIYLNAETIIKGDEREAAIALASVAAKVSRDRRMRKLAERYPHYGFDQHKGYGTRGHFEALQTYGPTPEHRRSFLRRLALPAGGLAL